MFETLVNTSKALLDAADALSNVQQDRRARLADLFEEVGDVLSEIINRKKHNKKSIDLCAELGVFAKALPDLAENCFPPEKVDNLSHALHQAQQARAMIYYSNHPDDVNDVNHTYNEYDKYVVQLEQAAGTFRGLAKVLRAQ